LKKPDSAIEHWSVMAGEVSRRDFVGRTVGAVAGWAAGVMFAGAADAAGAPTIVLINESQLRQKYLNEISSLLAAAARFAEQQGGALIDVGRQTTALAIKAQLARYPRRPKRLVIFGDEGGIPRFPIKARDVDIQIDSPYGDLDRDGLNEIAVSRVLGSPQAMIRQLGRSIPFHPAPHAVFLADHIPQQRPEGNRWLSLMADRGCTSETRGPGDPRILAQADVVALGAHGNGDGWWGELGSPFVTTATVPDLPRQPVAFAGACSTAGPGAPILQRFIEKGCRAYIGAVSDASGWTTGWLGNQIFMHFVDAFTEHPDWTVAEMVTEARNRYVRANNLQKLILRLEKGDSPDLDGTVTNTALQWQMFGDVTATFPQSASRAQFRKYLLAPASRAVNRGQSISVRYDVGSGDGLPLLFFQADWDRDVSSTLQVEILQNGTSLHKLDWREQREWWAYADTAVGGYWDRGRYYAFAVVPLVRRQGVNEAIIRVNQSSKPIEVLTGSALQVWPQQTAAAPLAQHSRAAGPGDPRKPRQCFRVSR
jgi:hypothetical protein